MNTVDNPTTTLRPGMMVTLADISAPTIFQSGIVDDVVGIPKSVLAGTPITYTLTFSEAIDEASVTSDSFGNAGTAGISFGTITKTAPNVFTLIVSPTTSGTVQLKINNSLPFIKDLAGNNLATFPTDPDVITATVDTTPPVLAGADITDDIVGNTVTAGTVITYTLDFKEDMNAATVTASDFGNAIIGGSAASASISSVTEVSPGIFELIVVPSSPGQYLLQVKSGVVLSDTSGNNLNTSSAIIDEDTFTVVIDNVAPVLAGSEITPTDALGNPITGPITVGTPVTYTLVFGEEMNDASISAADFTNAGTAGFTIDSVTEVSPGVYAVVMTPTSEGSLIFAVQEDAIITDAAGNALDTSSPVTDNAAITVGSDTSPPLLTSSGIVDNVSGQPVESGTVMTYTITFNEDIDANSLTAADFSNAGTAGFSVTSVTEISPGVFEVEFIPTSTGTLVGAIADGATIEDYAGNPVDTTPAIPDDVAITVIQAPVGDPVVYTFDFGQDVDAATVNPEDFVNAGSADYVIGTITEVSPGVFEVQFIPTTTGTLMGELSPTATISNAGNLSVDPSTVTPDESTIPVGPAIIGNPVIATFDFGTDIDASTVSAEDFTSTGTAGYTIGTITEIRPGVFQVEYIPTTPGTIIPDVSPTAVIEDSLGNPMDPNTGSTSTTPINVVPSTGDPYLVWSGNTPSSADTNGDGVTNGTAWALGAPSPMANGADVMPTTTTATDGTMEMTFSMLNSSSLGAAQVILQQSSDLGMTDAWVEIQVPEVSTTTPVNGVIFTVTPGDPLNNVSLRVAPDQAAGGKLFSRLKIVTP